MIRHEINFVTVVAWIVCAALMQAAGADVIRLRDQAFITGSQVKLEDIAQLEGERALALREVVIAGMSEDDAVKAVGLETVRKALTAHGVNWAFVTLGGFERCVVEKQAAPQAPSPGAKGVSRPRTFEASAASAAMANVTQPVTAGPAAEPTLRDRVAHAIADFAGIAAHELRMTFDVREGELLKAPAPEGRFEVVVLSRQALGRVMVGVREYEGQSLVGKWNMAVEASRQAVMAAAARPLARGQRIAEGDVALREVVVTDGSVLTVASVEEVMGRAVTRNFRAGEAIDAGALDHAALVKRNDLVEVRAVVGAIVVTTRARAREDGALGQRVAVSNLSSREVFTAVVVGPGAVRVGEVETTNERGNESLIGRQER